MKKVCRLFAILIVMIIGITTNVSTFPFKLSIPLSACESY